MYIQTFARVHRNGMHLFSCINMCLQQLPSCLFCSALLLAKLTKPGLKAHKTLRDIFSCNRRIKEAHPGVIFLPCRSTWTLCTSDGQMVLAVSTSLPSRRKVVSWLCTYITNLSRTRAPDTWKVFCSDICFWCHHFQFFVLTVLTFAPFFFHHWIYQVEGGVLGSAGECRGVPGPRRSGDWHHFLRDVRLAIWDVQCVGLMLSFLILTFSII